MSLRPSLRMASALSTSAVSVTGMASNALSLLDANILIRRRAKLRATTQKRLETMTTKDHLARHDSQISRLEQVMTALAEAQVKTEEAQAKTGRELAKLARAMTALAESQ